MTRGMDGREKNQIHLQLGRASTSTALRLLLIVSRRRCWFDGRNKSEELSGCPYLAALEEVRDYTKRADTAILHVAYNNNKNAYPWWIVDGSMTCLGV